MSNNPLKLEDFGAILRRRKLHILIPAALILLMSGALAYILPPAYISTAKILIEQQEIPQDLVTSTVMGYAAERIQIIQNRVMTRDNLWAMAEEFDLYSDIRTQENQQDILDQMREDILITMVSADVVDPKTGRSSTPTIAFTVSYKNESPKLAQSVTAKLAELYLNENRISRTEETQQTTSFLEAEAQRLQTQISELGAKVSAFKVKNAGSLPDTFEATSRMLADAQQQLGLLEAKLPPLESRYTYLKNRLTGFGSSALLAKARAELAAARDKYSDIHPDVVRLKRTVETLEAGGSSAAYESTGSDPEYLALQSELQQVAGDIGGVRSQRTDLKNKIDVYQSRLTQSPEVEREYSALTRDLDHATSKYSDIMNKLTSAKLAEELEREQKAERFILIEPAIYPSEPSEPNIPAIMLLGLTFALGVGISIAALAEYLDKRIFGPNVLATVFKAPPLAIIPEIRG
jgi:polysaccharide chain length determinant protein (PEP-CTERM system associated)